MQTLGLSDSTPRTEGRLKSLFWPSIETGADVDYLGRQGFWVCTTVAILSFVMDLIFSSQVLMGLVILLFYYLAGVGVRERSRYAATVAFATYAFTTLVLGVGLLSGGGVIRIIFCGLLLSNLRATWIAAGWRPESEQAALPPRLRDTWGDKVADEFPLWFWPKVRIAYYIYSAAVIGLEVNWILVVALRNSR